MLCPNCKTPLEDGAAFCGTCGTSVALQANNGKTTVRDKTVADNSLNSRALPDNTGYETSQPLQYPKSSIQATYLPPHAQTPEASVPKQINTPPSFPQNSPRKNGRRTIMIVSLLVILVAAGTIATTLILRNNNNSLGGNPAVTANTSGQVAFIDIPNSIPGQTNGLSIAINGLNTPPSGSQYMAWLVNDQTEQIVPLGTLVASGQKFSLTYPGATGSTQQATTNLIGFGNKIEITQEQGQVSLPTGKVILTGIFPPKAFVHIRHLLFKFPTTPHNIGLLVGLMNQTQLLNGQALIMQNAVNGGNHAAIQCAAQSIIDISEGTNGTNYKPLDANCAALNITQTGDGFGILGQGYLITAASHASLAANQTDSTANIRLHASHIIIATNNIKGWVTTVDQDALKLLNDPTHTSVVQEIVTLSDHAYHGVDTNGDEQVDPVPGEAGAITAYIHGQLMAALPLTANG